MLGMWIWQQNVQTRGAETVALRCAQAGVTDLYFLTKGLSGLAAYDSRFAPHACQRDLLQEITDAAHRHGMRVHAWFTSTCDEHYKQLHPESGRCHLRRGKDRELISLADEGYLAYMEKIVGEVCRRHEVDGIHLDYIRYNHLLYGWAEEDMARYRRAGANAERVRELVSRMFGEDPAAAECLFDAYRSGDEDVLAFARARRRDVVHFAQTLLSAARAQRSDLILSAALMPEGAYEDTAFADLHYGQNYEDAARLYDLVLPMAYSHAYQKDAEWVKQVAEGTIRRGLKTLVGLHAYEGGTGPALARDLQALQNVPVQGVCLFREGATALGDLQQRALHIYNALPETITSVAVQNGEASVSLPAAIPPDGEMQFVLPLQPENVRVYTGDREACIYLKQRL